MTRTALTVDDAANVLRNARDEAPAALDVSEVLDAGLALLARVENLESELERTRARATGLEAANGAGIEGHPLVERLESGGRRHFLAGRPVHAGSGLYLLTFRGWHPGRYEWTFRESDRPVFYFSLPGVREELAIPIPRDARLAWSDELRAE